MIIEPISFESLYPSGSTALEVKSYEFSVLMWRINHWLRNDIKELMLECGLQERDFDLLVAIRVCGTPSVSALSQLPFHQFSPQEDISEQLKSLFFQGVICKVPATEGEFVELTGAGLQLVEAVMFSLQLRHQRVIEQFHQKDTDRLTHLLAKVESSTNQYN